MSAEMYELDRSAFVGQSAWHGLGIVVPDGDWDAVPLLHKAGVQAEVDTGEVWVRRKVPGINAAGEPCMVETDFRAEAFKATLGPCDDKTGIPSIHGIVGSGFELSHPLTLCEVVQEAGLKVETLGTMRNQSHFFLLVRLAEPMTVRPGDEVHRFGLISTAHDGSKILLALPTSVRVVCRNTEGMAIEAAKRAGLAVGIKHTKGLRNRVAEVAAVFSKARQEAGEMEREIRALSNVRMNDAATADIFGKVYAATYGEIPDPKNAANRGLVKGAKAKQTRAYNMIQEWTRNLRAEAEHFNTEPDAWLALNAMTRWSDHERSMRSRNGQKPDRNFVNLYGAGADFKAKAKAQVLEAAGV